jgi:hypothetical protein
MISWPGYYDQHSFATTSDILNKFKLNVKLDDFMFFDQID